MNLIKTKLNNNLLLKYNNYKTISSWKFFNKYDKNFKISSISPINCSNENKEYYLNKIDEDNNNDIILKNIEKINKFKKTYPQIYNEINDDIEIIDTMLFCDCMYDNIKNEPEMKIIFRSRIKEIMKKKNLNIETIKLLIEYIDKKCK